MRKMLLALFIAGLMLAVMAGPAFAFHHGFLPVTSCAANDEASNNPTARQQLIEQGLFPRRLLPMTPLVKKARAPRLLSSSVQTHHSLSRASRDVLQRAGVMASGPLFMP